MRKTESRRYLSWYVVIASLLSVYMLYNKSLFNGSLPNFDKPLYISALLSSIAFLFVSVAVRSKFKDLNGSLILLIALVPVSFVISSFFAASRYMSLNAIIVALLYFIFFVLGLLVATQPTAVRIAGNVVLGSGFGVVIFGLMNWLGNASLWGLLHWTNGYGQRSSVFTDSVWVAADGPRLASVFQYSNTYAGYLIALLLASVTILAYSKSKVMTTLTSVMLVPIILSFFLTLSRGGLVILPVVFIILLFLLRPAKQWFISINLFLGLVISLGILSPITRIGKDLQTEFHAGPYTIGWLLIVAGSAVFAALFWALNKFATSSFDRIFTRYEAAKFSSVYLPAAIIVLGIGIFYLLTTTSLSNIFPDNIKTRIENINLGTETVQERGAFYSDALKIFLDYPVVGAGGGAWRVLYPSYQEYPYISAQAHNFLMQYLVETGIFGIVILLLLLGTVFVSCVRYFYQERMQRRDPDPGILLFLIVAVGLLAHSLIDFDMSYSYISSLVFFSLGIVGSRTKLPKKFTVNVKYNPWFILIPSFAAIVMAGLLTSAHTNYQKSIDYLQGGQPLQAIISPLNRAISITENPRYLALKLDIYRQVYSDTQSPEFQQEAEKTIEAFKKYEPHDRLGYVRSLLFYQSADQYEEATTLADQAIAKFPWSIEVFEQAISAYAQKGNQEQDHASWNEALQLYHDVLDKNEWLSGQSVSQTFGITKPIATTIGQIHFYQGNFNDSFLIMQPFIVPQRITEDDRTLWRYYLASMQKLNLDPGELYNQLVSAFPDEAGLIDQLLASQ